MATPVSVPQNLGPGTSEPVIGSYFEGYLVFAGFFGSGFVEAGVHYYEGEVAWVGEAPEGQFVENDAGAYDGEGASQGTPGGTGLYP
jgi:hypothetical protein